ncbi:MAG: adenylosuccinate lyase [Actinobacteria bacterium]|uniref:Adenylosuccinate lyase n=1 Tax=freshwater metagenome TaxID=449393 RepID=A0A6J6WTM3_9ZZZZ|nr:adenylosuccinate lyase [Actinomycetota bacterium]
MISRYAPKDVAALFTDEHRFDTMLEVELLAAEALVDQGVVPAADAATLRSRRPVVDAAFVADVNAREEITNHDTAAFVDIVQDRIGMPEGAWIHYGLTSSDVVDTALCKVLTDAMDIVITEVRAFRDALTTRAVESIDWPITGRTHGMHAEPTTYGAKFALFALQANRDLERVENARRAIAVGKLSGAVGTFSNIDPEVENFVCTRLGLAPVPATQVIARDRHAEVLYSLAAVGTTIEQVALEVRHLARSEVGEAEEPFGKGQKGSSAMPHKRNPVLSERLCGLARVLRGYLVSGLEDVALWHERDISHSSVERVVMPDALQLCVYMLRKATGLASGLVLKPERALENLEVHSLGLVFSQSILLALVDSGMSRDDAYRIVQAAARRSVETRENFRVVIAQDNDVNLSEEQLKRAFDATRLLAHRGRFVEALTWRTA